MSRQKTRKEKIRITESRRTQGVSSETHEYTLPQQTQLKTTAKVSASDFFAYDIKLIYQDIRKTLIVVAIFVIALIGISFYLR